MRNCNNSRLAHELFILKQCPCTPETKKNNLTAAVASHGAMVLMGAAAVVLLVPLLGAATPFGGGSVFALAGGGPLLAVALGHTTSDAMKVSGEVSLHAVAVAAGSRVADGASVNPFVAALAISAAVAVASLGAQLLAGWPAVGRSTVLLLLNLSRHHLGGQPLAALPDDAVALDENVRFHVTTVCDLTGASRGVEMAIGFHLTDLNALTARFVAELASLIARNVRVVCGHVRGSGALVKIRLELRNRFSGVDHVEEFLMDCLAITLVDAHLRGRLADLRGSSDRQESRKHWGG